MWLFLACTEPAPEPAHTLRGAITTLDLEPVVVGEGDVVLNAAGTSLTPVVSGDIERFALHGTWTIDGASEPRLWRQGWQSWSWSGVTALDRFAMDGDFPAIGGDLDGFATLDELDGTSWEAVGIGDDGAAAVLGARSAATGKVWFAVDDGEIWIVWDGPFTGGPLDTVTLYDGAPIEELWATYADDVPGRVVAEPPTGWLDWYTFYGEVTEADIAAKIGRAHV